MERRFLKTWSVCGEVLNPPSPQGCFVALSWGTPAPELMPLFTSIQCLRWMALVSSGRRVTPQSSSSGQWWCGGKPQSSSTKADVHLVLGSYQVRVLGSDLGPVSCRWSLGSLPLWASSTSTAKWEQQFFELIKAHCLAGCLEHSMCSIYDKP